MPGPRNGAGETNFWCWSSNNTEKKKKGKTEKREKREEKKGKEIFGLVPTEKNTKRVV